MLGVPYRMPAPIQPKGRRILKLIALGLLLLGSAACVPETQSNSCGATGLGALIGQDRTVLHTKKFATPLRVVEFGQPITMDFNPERLNIDIDKNGLISRVWCG